MHVNDRQLKSFNDPPTVSKLLILCNFWAHASSRFAIYHVFSLDSSTSTTTYTTSFNLLPNPPQQRPRLPTLILSPRKPQPLPPPHPTYPPTTLLLRLLKKLLILLKRPPTRLRLIQIRIHPRKDVCKGEDEEKPASEVVEEDGGDEGYGEVGEAPDDDGDGGAEGAGGGWVDFGWDEEDWWVWVVSRWAAVRVCVVEWLV